MTNTPTPEIYPPGAKFGDFLSCVCLILPEQGSSELGFEICNHVISLASFRNLPGLYHRWHALAVANYAVRAKGYNFVILCIH